MATLLTTMSVAFVIVLPFVMGYTSVSIAERKSQHSRVWVWFLLPWIPVVAALAASLIVLLEGRICVVLFLPIALLISSLGGVTAGLVVRRKLRRKTQNITMAVVLLLPFLVHPFEAALLRRNDIRTVENVVDIEAPPSVVWGEIKRVPKINKRELPPSWSQRIGFPDPVEATLSYEGVGGVRHATFAGGVLFIENVDVWEPEHRLAFSIHAQTAQIPPTTLDEHVTVGGPFFDVLRGEYTLESLAKGGTRLHLASHHRVSTDFNWYAHLWSDAVMSDLQTRILRVVKNRAEATAR
jgi:hypothetical protein